MNEDTCLQFVHMCINIAVSAHLEMLVKLQAVSINEIFSPTHSCPDLSITNEGINNCAPTPYRPE